MENYGPLWKLCGPEKYAGCWPGGCILRDRNMASKTKWLLAACGGRVWGGGGGGLEKKGVFGVRGGGWGGAGGMGASGRPLGWFGGGIRGGFGWLLMFLFLV